eukprot:15033144-Heterocapsa_arctica.AAC.1
MFLRLNIELSSSDVAQKDQRPARNLMMIARMPEDRSKTFKNLQNLLKTFKATYTCVCTPVGPTDIGSYHIICCILHDRRATAQSGTAVRTLAEIARCIVM